MYFNKWIMKAYFYSINNLYKADRLQHLPYFKLGE